MFIVCSLPLKRLTDGAHSVNSYVDSPPENGNFSQKKISLRYINVNGSCAV